MITPYKRIFIPLIITFGRKKAERIFTDVPIFIGGCGRSGTTLLLSILSSHPTIFACRKELSLFKYGKEHNGRFEPERLDRLYTTILKARIGNGVTRWCEKTPDNIRYIDRIDSYLQGEYRFIQMIRDGRDVILSRHPSNKRRYHVDPERWVNDVQAGVEHMDQSNLLTIRYESLVGDYYNTMETVCDHLGIDMSEELSNWYKYSTVRNNPAYFSGLEKMHNNSIGQWKKPENKKRVDELLNHPGAIALLKKFSYL